MVKVSKRVADFIGNSRLTVLATGSPPDLHTSAMHFSFDADIGLYFSTDRSSVKVANIEKYPFAAATIGWNEDNWITVQLRGTAHILDTEPAIARAKSFHYPIHPNSERFEYDPGTIWIVLSPVWVRYSDLGLDVPEIQEFK